MKSKWGKISRFELDIDIIDRDKSYRYYDQWYRQIVTLILHLFFGSIRVVCWS